AIEAVLVISQPGMEGGRAVADVLSGAVNPSGKLTDTWAFRYADYPNAATFSHNNGNVEQEITRKGCMSATATSPVLRLPGGTGSVLAWATRSLNVAAHRSPARRMARSLSR